METFNSRLKLLMDHLGFTSRNFDKEIGVPQTQTSSVVGPKQTIPRTDYAIKIKGRFQNVNLNWLLAGEGEMFNDPNKENHKLNEESLVQENKMLKQRIQGLEFGLSLAANSANFQQGNTAVNFKLVSRNAPVKQHQLKIVWTAPNSSTNSRDEVSRRAL